MTNGSRSGFCVLANRMVTLTSGMSGRQTTSSQRSVQREEAFPNSFHLISGWPDCQLWWSAQFWWAQWSKGWCKNTPMSFKMFKTLKDWKMLMKLFRSRATSCLVWIRRASKSMSLSHLCTRWSITTIAFVIYLFCSVSEFVTINTMMVKILLDWWTRSRFVINSHSVCLLSHWNSSLSSIFAFQWHSCS